MISCWCEQGDNGVIAVSVRQWITLYFLLSWPCLYHCFCLSNIRYNVNTCCRIILLKNTSDYIIIALIILCNRPTSKQVLGNHIYIIFRNKGCSIYLSVGCGTLRYCITAGNIYWLVVRRILVALVNAPNNVLGRFFINVSLSF